jgi:hypothetical protein
MLKWRVIFHINTRRLASLKSGAGEESRTLDLNLGKVALYQLSYSRIGVQLITVKHWSGRRVSNSRPQPWQGCALPTELLPHGVLLHISTTNIAPVWTGAGEESRTLDLNLGKVALYQLSYSRISLRLSKKSILHHHHIKPANSGAGEESRTLDLNLGKGALYQLSYSRFVSFAAMRCNRQAL